MAKKASADTTAAVDAFMATLKHPHKPSIESLRKFLRGTCASRYGVPMNKVRLTRKLVVLCSLTALLAMSGCDRAPATKVVTPPDSYLFVWAGDADDKASDFLAVIDADSDSPHYGAVVASLPTGESGAHPHHTEHEMSPTGHLLANGFHAGRTWLFDLTKPLEPRILTAFDDLAGFSHPHTFIRMDNGNILATFQYAASGKPDGHAHEAGQESERAENTPGGLVEMTERGEVIRTGSARDTRIPDPRIYPYSVLPLPTIDRAVSTTTDMDHTNEKATSEWVQFWQLSDLTLLKTIALKPGPKGDEHKLSGEPRLLPDGTSIYIHTFSCGLYLVRGAGDAEPDARLVYSFPGFGCGVPVLTGNYWLQPVPETHALVALDISDPENPREVSSVSFGDDEEPHWIAIDPTGRRVVLNSGGAGNRLFVVNFDPATGKLTMDERFRDPDDPRPGFNLNGKTWPHGFTGKAAPHGAVFSNGAEQ
jgi:hypothetical protein